LRDKKENMNVRELFRYKLENSESIPGDSVRTDLMRTLARREFIRFNPLRFNIYYLGAIVAAGVVATLLITSNPGDGRKSEVITPTEEKLLADTVSSRPINEQQSEERLVLSKIENDKNNNSESVSNIDIKPEGRTIVKKPVVIIGNVVAREKSDSLQKKSLIKDNLPDKSNIFALQKKTEAAFKVSSPSGCTPLKVRFLNRSTSYDSCRWVFGDGGSSREINPEWIFDVEGEYKVVLKVFSSNGTEAVASSVITVHPKPLARFEINPPNPIIPDDEIRFLNYSMDGVKYRWDFGDGKVSEAFEPDHRYEKYKNYNVRLIVWSEYGCSDSLMVINAFSGSGCYIIFPNAFIPNPDGPAGGYYSTKSDEAAQIFHPETSGVSDYQLRIFSKMGILIFESNDINIGWDGYLKGQHCEPGVYIWKVRGTYKNGEPFVKMGDVTLLKKQNLR
jgi:PKD repeat protein